MKIASFESPRTVAPQSPRQHTWQCSVTVTSGSSDADRLIYPIHPAQAQATLLTAHDVFAEPSPQAQEVSRQLDVLHAQRQQLERFYDALYGVLQANVAPPEHPPLAEAFTKMRASGFAFPHSQASLPAFAYMLKTGLDVFRNNINAGAGDQRRLLMQALSCIEHRRLPLHEHLTLAYAMLSTIGARRFVLDDAASERFFAKELPLTMQALNQAIANCGDESAELEPYRQRFAAKTLSLFTGPQKIPQALPPLLVERLAESHFYGMGSRDQALGYTADVATLDGLLLHAVRHHDIEITPRHHHMLVDAALANLTNPQLAENLRTMLRRLLIGSARNSPIDDMMVDPLQHEHIMALTTPDS